MNQLSEAERREIEMELKHYRETQAGCVEAMKVVQRHRGWVSDESLRGISELTGMSVAELDAVATFYNMIFRKPVGRHVVLACDSISCWVMGCERIHAHLKNRLGLSFGQTSPDHRFSLLPMVCLGACDRAPVMMVDDDLHGNLLPERVDKILEQYK